jgi:hypothetical protein
MSGSTYFVLIALTPPLALASWNRGRAGGSAGISEASRHGVVAVTIEETNPGAAVEAAVEKCLAMATTWIAWEGGPCVTADRDRIYTPHKAVRRITDHIVDHLAEVEALLAGVPTEPDAWHGSLITFESDWARFTEGDLNEARQRLRRLGRTFTLRYAAAGPSAWDEPRGDNWTLRAIAEHLTSVVWYAEQVGKLH